MDLNFSHVTDQREVVSVAVILLLAILGQTADAKPEVTTATSYYLIGNSLTWDTSPSRLSGDVQWHVDCGKSLPYIFKNPEEPCVRISTVWPKALKEKQYDFLSIQPHYGSTIEQDVQSSKSG
ncbi:MAG: hypothetical protein CMJ78_22540 [Planctomycetaceae bacterium]|nr:hypothetical protein [Planctomycetaceae bacterium]